MARLASLFAPALFLAVAAGCASSRTVGETVAPASKASQGPRPAPESPSDLVADAPNEAIFAVYKAKCGACHTRVEPGSLARATAESAMQRHRRRAKLSERQWEDMVDLLSADHLVHARPTAQN